MKLMLGARWSNPCPGGKIGCAAADKRQLAPGIRSPASAPGRRVELGIARRGTFFIDRPIFAWVIACS